MTAKDGEECVTFGNVLVFMVFVNPEMKLDESVRKEKLEEVGSDKAIVKVR